jgi:hypothetical protein
MQLHFHISRHIAHLGLETPVFFTLFTLSTYGTVVSNWFFQRFIFSAKKSREKYSERIWVFHCKDSIRKKTRVIVVALPSCMM